MPEPPCPFCQGAGYTLDAVPYWHPRFGVLTACVCNLDEIAAKDARILRDLADELQRYRHCRLDSFDCNRPIVGMLEWEGAVLDEVAMRAVISLRVSTDEQAEEGYSLAAQERACRHHCEVSGWTIVGVYVDEGLSGTLEVEARPGLAAALALIRSGRADALVVHKLDRLARSVRIANQLIEEFQRRGVAFVAVVDRIDLSTPFGWAAFQMQNVWNELYIKNLSFETAKGHREKAKQGGWVGPVPLGYLRDGRSLRPSEDAAIITLIFERYNHSKAKCSRNWSTVQPAGHACIATGPAG